MGEKFKTRKQENKRKGMERKSQKGDAGNRLHQNQSSHIISSTRKRFPISPGVSKKRAKHKSSVEVADLGKVSCYECGVVKNSADDTQLAEGWIQCSQCLRWDHESCGEVGGLFDDEHFYCTQCAVTL